MDLDVDQPLKEASDLPDRQHDAKRHSENALVAEHYSNRGNQSFKKRRESPIIALKNFNNWIKSILIHTWSRRDDFALDIGGGKGGDFNKWKKADIWHLVLADVAAGSVEDAVERYNDGRYRFSAQFISADCCNPRLRAEFASLDFFDVVSCQFAIHYSFETLERSREFVRNAASKLRPGGYFFGTTVDMRVLTERIRDSEDGRRCGNSQYSVVFDEFGADGPQNGSRYVFSLVDAVTNVPEYLVDPTILTELCEQEGLELVRMQNFYSMYNEEMPSIPSSSSSSDGGRGGHHHQQQQRNRNNGANNSNIPSSSSKFDPETWDTLGIYMAFVYRKKGEAETLRHRKPTGADGRELRPGRVSKSSIAYLTNN